MLPFEVRTTSTTGVGCGRVWTRIVRILPSASAALSMGCIEPLREGPDPPANPSAGAVILGAARTSAGVAVAGATGEINVYRELTDGSLAYVGGVPLTTDQMGEFDETVVLADVGLFNAKVRVVIDPPAHFGLQRDSAEGTVPFTADANDTLRLTITLDPV